MHIDEISIARGDYAPWTAEFTDGTYISLLDSQNVTYAAVIARSAELHAFYIHFSWSRVAGVCLLNGKFYLGARAGDASGWFESPESDSSAPYSLIYSRQYRTTFDGVNLSEPAIKSYTIGWTGTGSTQCMLLVPDGSAYTWR